MLTADAGLCCAGTTYLAGAVVGVRTQRLAVCWAQLGVFRLKTETESSLRNVVFLNKRQDNG
jgi:hypothetical protein